MFFEKPFNLRAFTLIEILVSIAIIALLFTVVMLSLNKMRTYSVDTRRIEDIHQIRNALELYQEQYNKYPNSLNELVQAGFMSAVPFDPSTNQQYLYGTSSDNSDFVLKASLYVRNDILGIDYDNDIYGVSCSGDDNADTGPYDYCIRP